MKYKAHVIEIADAQAMIQKRIVPGHMLQSTLQKQVSALFTSKRVHETLDKLVQLLNKISSDDNSQLLLLKATAPQDLIETWPYLNQYLPEIDVSAALPNEEGKFTALFVESDQDLYVVSNFEVDEQGMIKGRSVSELLLDDGDDDPCDEEGGACVILSIGSHLKGRKHGVQNFDIKLVKKPDKLMFTEANAIRTRRNGIMSYDRLHEVCGKYKFEVSRLRHGQTVYIENVDVKLKRKQKNGSEGSIWLELGFKTSL